MSCCKARRKRLEREKSVGQCFFLLLELNSLRIAILNFENKTLFSSERYSHSHYPRLN